MSLTPEERELAKWAELYGQHADPPEDGKDNTAAGDEDDEE